nr:MAG: RdRp [Plasmopara viticola lesion associated narnavirus 45]
MQSTLVGNTGAQVITPKMSGQELMTPESHFTLPLEAHESFNGFFNPDVGLGDVGESTIQFSEIESLANERLGRYGYDPISKQDYSTPCNHISSEVGDDEETLFQSKAHCGFNMAFHILSGMKVSEEDTCVNSRYGNFAEDMIILPDSYYQTYVNTRNTSSTKDMSYIDVPKLRLATDIRPMRMDHSATNDGKAAMLGSRLAWVPLDHPTRGIWESFNLFQDIHLGIHREKRFAYLPQSLGGYGKPIPFNQPENLERFCSAFKQGQHTELIRSIVRRTNTFLGNEKRLIKQEPDPLLAHVAKFQSSFHDWIKGKSVYAPISWIGIPPELEGHKVEKPWRSRELDDVVGRLLQDRVLVTESALQIAVEHNELCKALLDARTIPEFKKLREDAIRDWRRLSIFSLESYGMIKEINLDRDLKDRPLSQSEVLGFGQLVRDTRYNLKALLRDETVYWQSAMDEVYKSGPMMVKFGMVPRNKVGGMSFAAQSAQYRSDIEDTTLKGGHEALIKWLRSDRRDPAPREMINDDHSIIREASEYTSVCLVTDDIRLCRDTNFQTGNPVFRVPVEWYYRALYFGDEPSPWLEYIKRKSPNRDWVEILDTGSIQSFEENFFKDGSMSKTRIRQRFNPLKPMGVRDPVVYTESENYSSDPPDYCNPDDLLFDRFNVILQRRNHKKGYRMPQRY